MYTGWLVFRNKSSSINIVQDGWCSGTNPPSTDAPTTAAPTTSAPTTAAPSTSAPTTAAPVKPGKLCDLRCVSSELLNGNYLSKFLFLIISKSFDDFNNLVFAFKYYYNDLPKYKEPARKFKVRK